MLHEAKTLMYVMNIEITEICNLYFKNIDLSF